MNILYDVPKHSKVIYCYQKFFPEIARPPDKPQRTLKWPCPMTSRKRLPFI